MNKLKLITVLVFLLTVLGASSSFAESMMLEYDGGVYQYNGAIYKLMVNNKSVQSALEPIVFNDRALVPVRDVFEEVGATVRYNSVTQTVEVVDNNAYIRMKINDNVAYVNGAKTSIPDSVVPKLISKVGGETKTMVPVRFISETIGLSVDFDSENGAILIDSDQYIENAPTAKPRPTAVQTARPADVDYKHPSDLIAKTPEPAQTPQPTATPAPQKINISNISYKNVETGKIAVTVQMNGEAKYSYFTLNDPERLVVDIQNASYASGENTMYVNNGGIKAVRIGVSPERTRVVVDMDKMINYSFGKDGNNLIIYARALSDTEPTPTPAPTPIPPKDSSVKYNKEVVVLDAGHGGYDPGAQGSLNGQTVSESSLTLQITNKVKGILENNGYTVVMTRTDDTYKTLIERPQLGNKSEAAVFVSIHINSADNAPSASGTEVFYAESNNGNVGGVTSSTLAKNILDAMIANTGSVNRGVKTAEHAVTKRSNMPACLAEVGFITNEKEIANMSNPDYQYKTAQGIAEGIMKTIRMME